MCGVIRGLYVAYKVSVPGVGVISSPRLGTFTDNVGGSSCAIAIAANLLTLLGSTRLTNIVNRRLARVHGRSAHLLVADVVFINVIAAIVAVIIEVLCCGFLFSNHSHGSGGGNKNTVLILIVNTVYYIVTCIFALVAHFTVSHGERCVTSTNNTRLYNSPQTLTSTLQGVSHVPKLSGISHRSITRLFVVHPGRTARKLVDFVGSLFSARPSPTGEVTVLRRF